MSPFLLNETVILNILLFEIRSILHVARELHNTRLRRVSERFLAWFDAEALP